MASRPLVEFILQAINCVFIICGLGTLGYGLVCLVQWKQNPPKEIIHEINAKFMISHRLLLAVDLPNFSFDSLPKAWFIYLLIGIGGILFIISCCGYVGTASRSPCCLLFYCVFLILLGIVELGTAAFIFFTHNWKKVIPKDKSGRFHSIYHFLSAHWDVIRWITLGVFILQVIAMVLALYMRSVFNRDWYDKGYDERIVHLPRVRPYNYRVLTHQSSCTPTTTISNRTDPTKPMKSQ